MARTDIIYSQPKIKEILDPEKDTFSVISDHP